MTRRRLESPCGVRGRDECAHDIVIALQQLRRRDEMCVRQERSWKRLEGSRMRVAFHVFEHLVTAFVDPQHSWRGKVSILEESEQRVHGRRPGSGGAPNGVPDAYRIVEIAAERDLVTHTVRVVASMSVRRSHLQSPP